MNKRPRAHRPSASEGSAGSSGGSGSSGRNGGGSAGTRRELDSQVSTTMSARPPDEDSTAAGRWRGGHGDVGSSQDFYESGSDEESRSSSSKRRRSSYGQSRSRAGDTTASLTASLTNVDVGGPTDPIHARASTLTLIHQETADVASTAPRDAIPPVTCKETCDLTDWEALKVLFVRAIEAFDDDTDEHNQSASTLLHAVLNECNRFLTFYKDPSVLFLPISRKKAAKGSSPSALTPPDVRLRRDWGVGSGSSSGSGSSWPSHRGYHTDEEVPPPPVSAPPSVPTISPDAGVKPKRRSKKKNNDAPTAFHTLYGTALLLYGILVSQSSSTQEDENQETPQEGIHYRSPSHNSPMQGISPTPSNPPRLGSISSSSSQGALLLAHSPRHSPVDSSTHLRVGLGFGQVAQRPILLPSQPYIQSPTCSTTTSPSVGALTPSASSTSGATGTGSTSVSNVRPISSRTSSSASASTPPSSYFSIPLTHQHQSSTMAMPLIPVTRSAFASPVDPKLLARKKQRYPPTYYWLAALDVFATGEAVVSERAGLEVAGARTSSSLDTGATVHDPFFSPTKQSGARRGHHHFDSRPHQTDLTSYEFPSDKNPFRTSLGSVKTSLGSHEFPIGYFHSSDSHAETSGRAGDQGTSATEKGEGRKRKRKRDGDSKGQKEKEDWRLPLGWGRTLVCLADEKASAELQERERLRALAREGIPDEMQGADGYASQVPPSFYPSHRASEDVRYTGKQPSGSPLALPEPVTVTTPNGSTKNMVSSQTPLGKRAQLLKENAHHLLILAVDQFTRGMLYMPRSTLSQRGNVEVSIHRRSDSNVEPPLDQNAPSGETATSPASATGPAPSLPNPQLSPLPSPSEPVSPPPGLSDLLPFSRTRTLVSIANSVLDVAAKLSVPDDRAYWGRWVSGILDVDERMNSPSSGQGSPSIFGIGTSSPFSSSFSGSMAIFSSISNVHGLGPGLLDNVFADQSAAREDKVTEDAKAPEEDLDLAFQRLARTLAKARAWVLMGTAINAGTSEKVRLSEEREARDALRKAMDLLENCLSGIEKYMNSVDEQISMSTSSSGDTVTQENVDPTSKSESQPKDVSSGSSVPPDRWKTRAINLQRHSQNLLYDTYCILMSLLEELERGQILVKARNLHALISSGRPSTNPSPSHSNLPDSPQEDDCMDCDTDPSSVISAPDTAI